jgi:hypothetical protein
MYPADILAYGESAIGTGAVFVLLRFVGANDILAVYLVQVLLLTLMAVATLILAERLTGSLAAAVLSAFIFTTSNFVWAGIDHLPIHFYFFPLLSLFFFDKAMESRRSSDLVLAGIMGGLQAYFSMQVLAYHVLMLGIFLLFYARQFWDFPARAKWAWALGLILVALPVVLFYLNTVVRLNPVDAFPRSEWDYVYSMNLTDLLRAMPGKLITYAFTSPSDGGWAKVAHSAFPGLLPPMLALLGVVGLERRRLIMISVGAAALLFSLGTQIEVPGGVVQSPLVYFFAYVPLASYLRVGLRAFSLVLLALSILAGFGWLRLSMWIGRRNAALPRILLPLACLLIAAENISWPVNAFELKPYPTVPAGYLDFFEDKPDAVILDLPSTSNRWPFYIDEIIYVLWQTKHHRSILGGVNGHFPPSRLDTQLNTDQLPSRRAIQSLRRLGLTHIVWHKSMFLRCHPLEGELDCDPQTGLRNVAEAQSAAGLDQWPFMRLVFEDQDLKIYEVRRPGAGVGLPALTTDLP